MKPYPLPGGGPGAAASFDKYRKGRLSRVEERAVLGAVMKIRKSAEDYLEMILRLTEEKGYARSVDIAAGLGVSKPSVSVAMKQLREGGYISMDKDNSITLLDSGMEIARRIFTRHKVLTQILVSIGVDPETAQEDACRVEHDISPQTFDAIVRQLESMQAGQS